MSTCLGAEAPVWPRAPVWLRKHLSGRGSTCLAAEATRACPEGDVRIRLDVDVSPAQPHCAAPLLCCRAEQGLPFVALSFRGSPVRHGVRGPDITNLRHGGREKARERLLRRHLQPHRRLRILICVTIAQHPSGITAPDPVLSVHALCRPASNAALRTHSHRIYVQVWARPRRCGRGQIGCLEVWGRVHRLAYDDAAEGGSAGMKNTGGRARCCGSGGSTPPPAAAAAGGIESTVNCTGAVGLNVLTYRARGAACAAASHTIACFGGGP
eukprot:365555-Chlamydomonas_euryale.AAC.4